MASSLSDSPQHPLNPVIKPMLKEMLPEILVLEKLAYPIGWNETLFSNCLNKNHLNKVLLINKKLVGYFVVQIVLDEFHLLNVCVSPELQNQGLGKYLLSCLHHHAEKKMMNRILLEVRTSNKSARKLYKHFNYQTIGKRKGYYPSESNVNEREDALVMEYALS